jgi:hypothetical protein
MGTTPFEIRKKPMTAHMLAQLIVERATVDTPRMDAETQVIETVGLNKMTVVDADFARQLERELIDLKQRLLPQYLGRAQRAEHERDALLEQLIAARSATAAPVAWMYEEADYKETDVRGRGWHPVMGKYEPQDRGMVRNVVALYAAAPPVEVGAPDWAQQLPGAEIFDRAARYEYIRTLNPRQFAALYDDALADERFDDLVDRYRMKGQQP